LINIRYAEFIKENNSTTFANLYSELLPISIRVARSQLKKKSIYSYNKTKIDELAHDMSTEFILEQIKNPDRRVRNIPSWLHFIFKKIVYKRSNIRHDKEVEFDTTWMSKTVDNISTLPILQDSETDYINIIKEHPQYRWILYYLSKPYSYRRTFTLLMNIGVTKKYIRDNSTILIRVKKELQH